MSFAFSRRSFLKYTAVAAVAVAGASLFTGCKVDTSDSYNALRTTPGEFTSPELIAVYIESFVHANITYRISLCIEERMCFVYWIVPVKRGSVCHFKHIGIVGTGSTHTIKQFSERIGAYGVVGPTVRGDKHFAVITVKVGRNKVFPRFSGVYQLVKVIVLPVCPKHFQSGIQCVLPTGFRIIPIPYILFVGSFSSHKRLFIVE